MDHELFKNGLEQAIHMGGGATKLAKSLELSPTIFIYWQKKGYPPVKYVEPILNIVDPGCVKLKPWDLLAPGIKQLVLSVIEADMAL